MCAEIFNRIKQLAKEVSGRGRDYHESSKFVVPTFGGGLQRIKGDGKGHRYHHYRGYCAAHPQFDALCLEKQIPGDRQQLTMISPSIND